MKCTDLHERLADYLGGEMSPAEAAAADAHLAGCPACAAEVTDHRRTLAALSTLDTVDTAEAARQTRGLVVIAQRPVWMRWGLAALRTAAVLAAGIILGRAAFPRSTPVLVQSPPPEARPAEVAPAIATVAATAVHPRWISLARECGRGESSFACQLTILAETARQ